MLVVLQRGVSIASETKLTKARRESYVKNNRGYEGFELLGESPPTPFSLEFSIFLWAKSRRRFVMTW